MLEDKSRSIRRNAIRAIRSHGDKTHLGILDEVLENDPMMSRDVRSAKKNILHPPKKINKNGRNKNLEDVYKKLEEIRKLIH